jgi:S-adenosylmethionine:tRNA ribosyltransferase-isomerase
MTALDVPERLHFDLPAHLEAGRPAEARGLARDAVRMLVAGRADGRMVHARFDELPRFLDPGDLVVINTSATIPAAVDATVPDGTAVTVHFSTHLDGNEWVAELRRPVRDTTERWTGPPPADRLTLAGGGQVRLDHRYLDGRLWVVHLDLPTPALTYLAAHGRPIRYDYVREPWRLSSYQNVYAYEPGSAEMPSAGRPFTAEVLTRLVAKGIGVTPVVLHTGVASLEADESPYPERFRVPGATADAVNATHRAGGRVIAIGTTTVRALESAVDPDGGAHAADGWTDLVITPERGVALTDGLLTGWHEPAASHLLMLEAVAGRPLLERSYEAALAEGYLWHEFGDVHLILP